MYSYWFRVDPITKCYSILGRERNQFYCYAFFVCCISVKLWSAAVFTVLYCLCVCSHILYCVCVCARVCEKGTQRESRHQLVNDVFHLLTSDVAVIHFHYTAGWSGTHKAECKTGLWEQRKPRNVCAHTPTHTLSWSGWTCHNHWIGEELFFILELAM